MRVVFGAAIAALALCFSVTAGANPQPAAAPEQTSPPAVTPPAPPAEAAKPAAAAATDDANKKVCRRYKSTGSRLADRTVCKTKAEWRDDNIAIRKQLNNHNRQTTNGS